MSSFTLVNRDPPTFFHSTNPSTGPRTGVTTQQLCRTSPRVVCAYHSHFLHVHRWQVANAFTHRSSVIGKTMMFLLRRTFIHGGQ